MGMGLGTGGGSRSAPPLPPAAGVCGGRGRGVGGAAGGVAAAGRTAPGGAGRHGECEPLLPGGAMPGLKIVPLQQMGEGLQRRDVCISAAL
ncbi:Protein of unknown function [Gryllus bimaculatus]|nr:Protein of unknown function [Gryllus bimaculatus]